MSKDGYYGDFDSLDDERAAYNEFNKFATEQTPDCVPCYNCGNPMYQVSDNPKNNYCDECVADMPERLDSGNDLELKDD